jgi:hypothetical protein
VGKGALALSSAVAGGPLADTPFGGALAAGLQKLSRRAMPAPQGAAAEDVLPPPPSRAGGLAAASYEPPHALPRVALTALAFQPGEAGLLVGTGDGRVVFVVDGRASVDARARVADEVSSIG